MFAIQKGRSIIQQLVQLHEFDLLNNLFCEYAEYLYTTFIFFFTTLFNQVKDIKANKSIFMRFNLDNNF